MIALHRKFHNQPLVLRIRGTLPITPYGLYDPTKASAKGGTDAGSGDGVTASWTHQPSPHLLGLQIANWQKYDSRYISLHAIDFTPPMPSYNGISDGQMWYHYGEGWDRRYSVVVASQREDAEDCDLLNEGEADRINLGFLVTPQASNPNPRGRVGCVDRPRHAVAVAAP